MAAVPASASTVGLGGREAAQLTLANVGAGVQVKIQGGGGGTSNCTNDETNDSFIAHTDPLERTLSFDSKASGSCFYESSYSYFRITVKGANSEGREFDSSANVFMGSATAAPPRT